MDFPEKETFLESVRVREEMEGWPDDDKIKLWSWMRVVSLDLINNQMRKFLSRFIKPTIDPTKAVCTHRDLPEDRRASKLISYSRDECLSCATHICNICSEIHVNHHHVTKRIPPLI